MRWILLGAGKDFSHRLEKHEGEELIEIFESDDLDLVMLEMESWLRRRPSPNLPMVVEEPDWEDCMGGPEK